MTNISGFIDQFFTFIGTFTSLIRNLIAQMTPDWATLILLGLAGVGGFYLYKKFPQIKGYMVAVIYALVIFLLLKFV